MRARPDPAVYRRAGRPCPPLRHPILGSGQGDANRRTYWCNGCQPAAWAGAQPGEVGEPVAGVLLGS